MFDFVPKHFLVFQGVKSLRGNYGCETLSYVSSGSTGAYYLAVTWSSNTVSWYYTSNAPTQMNASDTTYYYVAFG